MSDVTLLGLPPSSYVRTALMVCAAKEVTCTLQPADFRSESYLAEHPFAKMPVLLHGPVKLFETLAIATYIDAVFEGPALQPADARARAEMMQWISVTNDYLYAEMVGKCVAERFVKPMRGLEPDEARIASAMPAITHQLTVLEAAMQQADFIVGDRLTLADCFLMPVLNYFAATPEGTAAMPACPRLSTWLDRMRALPGFQEINRLGP